MLGAVESALGGVHAAEREAQRNSALVHPVSWFERAAGMFEPAPEDRYATATVSGLVCNNLSALLFLVNYTAVLPATRELCQHLAISQSWTGHIMAASDLAAAFTAVAISYWTNLSFRQPLIFCAAVCVAGNVVYCMSYHYRSLGLLLVARALNGLGSCRTANRRYVADYVSKAHRTMASAAFVAASNLGLALGPFLALPLSHVPHTHLGGLPINPVTSVGVVMALLWLLFLAGTAAWFQDPPQESLPIGRSQSLPNLEEPLLAAEEAGGSSSVGVGGGAEAEGGEPTSGTSGASGQLKQRSSARDPGWKATVRGTLACVLCIFLQKAAQQAYYDSVPILTSVLYGWGSATVGIFLGTVALAMLPVEVLVGYLSSAVSDRALLVGALGVTAASLATMMRVVTSDAAYFAGGVAMFVGTVVLEVVATSLMTKVIWPGFARGTMNAGLLSTEAGTLGRFTGNAVLALVGHATGVERWAQLARFTAWLYGLLAAGCAVLVPLIVLWYHHLR